MNISAARAVPPSESVIPVERGGIRRKLAQVRMQLACAEDLFNCATDDAMLDSSIYQLKSLQVYYSFLMRQLRLEEDVPSPGGEEVPLAEGPEREVVESVG